MRLVGLNSGETQFWIEIGWTQFWIEISRTQDRWNFGDPVGSVGSFWPILDWFEIGLKLVGGVKECSVATLISNLPQSIVLWFYGFMVLSHKR